MGRSLSELLRVFKNKVGQTFVTTPGGAGDALRKQRTEMNALKAELNPVANGLMTSPRGIYQQGSSASGEDYTSSVNAEPQEQALREFIGDFGYGKAIPGTRGRVTEKRGEFHYLTVKTDDELLRDLRQAFKLASVGQSGNNPYIDRFTQHFKNGNGNDYRDTIYLTEMMLFVPIYKKLLNEIAYTFSQEMKKTTGDFTRVSFGNGRLSKFFPMNIAFGDNRILNMLVGGVQEIKIYLTKMQFDYNPNGGFEPLYKGELNIVIYDDFGVSEADTIKTAWATSLGRYAIIAMWILQHQRGYKPFRTIFSINLPVNGTF
jgi:hypothetical protein